MGFGENRSYDHGRAEEEQEGEEDGGLIRWMSCFAGKKGKRGWGFFFSTKEPPAGLCDDATGAASEKREKYFLHVGGRRARFSIALM